MFNKSNYDHTQKRKLINGWTNGYMDEQMIYNETLLINKKEIILLIHKTWMNLKNSMLNERSQAQSTYCMILLIWASKKKQTWFLMTENRKTNLILSDRKG